jgi:pilus assembly protein CpaF
VVAITEVQRMEADVITLQDLYKFEVDAVAATNHIVGELKHTGLRPAFLDKFVRRGIELPADFLAPSRPEAMALGASRG